MLPGPQHRSSHQLPALLLVQKPHLRVRIPRSKHKRGRLNRPTSPTPLLLPALLQQPLDTSPYSSHVSIPNLPSRKPNRAQRHPPRPRTPPPLSPLATPPAFADAEATTSGDDERRRQARAAGFSATTDGEGEAEARGRLRAAEGVLGG